MPYGQQIAKADAAPLAEGERPRRTNCTEPKRARRLEHGRVLSRLVPADRTGGRSNYALSDLWTGSTPSWSTRQNEPCGELPEFWMSGKCGCGCLHRIPLSDRQGNPPTVLIGLTGSQAGIDPAVDFHPQGPGRSSGQPRAHAARRQPSRRHSRRRRSGSTLLARGCTTSLVTS
jgi:hypothetical protein